MSRFTKEVSELNGKKNIYTIANELNLSPGTISKVINGTGFVSQATRERVKNYIQEVGYVPTSSARMLKSKRTYTVGVVFTEESNVGLEHAFFSSILQHFKTYLEKEGYELSFIVKKLGKNQMSYYEWCMNKRVDGVYIVVGNYADQGLHELVEKGIPCVSTDMILPNLKTVISDNDEGIRLSLEHVKHVIGKQRVAMISGPKSSKAFNERVASYFKYTSEFGLIREQDYLIYAESFGFTSGYQAVQKLLGTCLIRPEVILVASDDIALGVMKGINDLKLSIPEDIEVIGFDDITFARHFTPALTTIRQDTKMLGETAAKKLIQLIEHPSDEIPDITRCNVQLIERDSTTRLKT
jgi:DNA-binding LacI/PurR family transcriptional regulator